MPALPPLPETVRVAINQTYVGTVPVENIFHVQAPTDYPVDPTTLMAIAAGMFAAFDDEIMPVLSDQLNLDSVTVKDISTITGGVQTYVPAGAAPGGVSGAESPANVAAVISWHEGISYRGGHARTYLGGITASQLQTPTSFTDAFVALLLGAAADFKTHVSGAAGDLVVAHYYRDHELLDPPFASLISSATVNHRIDSQRRRLGR
jgi:hypothetical protein